MIKNAVLTSNLCHYYGFGENRKKVLDKVNINIKERELVLLKGPSGCGKTTLLTLIGALRTCQEGSLNVLTKELNGASRKTRQRLRVKTAFFLIIKLKNLSRICIYQFSHCYTCWAHTHYKYQ